MLALVIETLLDSSLCSALARQFPCKEEVIKAEVSAYKKAACIQLNESPLAWWKTHAKDFTALSKVARRCLCIPATSVPAERVAGEIVSALRSRLDPDNVDMLVFLNQNQV